MVGALVDVYWITWFPGSLLALTGILLLCWKGIRSFVTIQEAAATITRIEHEFSPNSGSSMRDQIDALRIEQTRVATNLLLSNEQMASHIRADADAFSRQDRTNTRVEATLDRIEDHVRGK